jgi:hypothetical protein
VERLRAGEQTGHGTAERFERRRRRDLEHPPDGARDQLTGCESRSRIIWYWSLR